MRFLKRTNVTNLDWLAAKLQVPPEVVNDLLEVINESDQIDVDDGHLGKGHLSFVAKPQVPQELLDKFWTKTNNYRAFMIQMKAWHSDYDEEDYGFVDESFKRFSQYHQREAFKTMIRNQISETFTEGLVENFMSLIENAEYKIWSAGYHTLELFNED